jgi:UDP-glucose 4-epimerase
MSVLVTGGAGYIGSHTVLALRDRGEEVVVLDDLSTGVRAVVPDDVTFIEGDMGDADLLAATIQRHRVEAVIHFAAKIVVPESVADPLGYYLANTCKARALIEAAARGGVRHFIFSSTAAVYGNPASNPVTEAMAGAPVSYDTSPMFYSDLFDLGYEAVGEIDSRLQTVIDWQEPYQKGVLYYLNEQRVRGVLLWNVWEQVDAARTLIAAGETVTLESLAGRIK